MTKRLLAGALSLALMLSLAGCFGSEAGSGSTGSGSASAQQPSGEGIVQPEDKPVPEVNLITGEALGDGMAPGQRPIAVMVSNIAAALPQRGVSAADAIIEMETEGGITRFLALFADLSAVPTVGPVRSARDQHLQFVLPLNAVFVHIGSSIYAQNLLNQYQYQDIDGLYLGTTSFALDEERRKTRAQEHCWYTDGAKIAAGMDQTGIVADGAKNTLFDFVEPGAAAQVPSDGDAPDIYFMISSGTAVQLTYDAASGTYLKKAYGEPQIDESNGAQLAFQNVVLLYAGVTMKPDGVCTDFDLSGGDGYYCYGGKYQKIRWEKGGATEPLRLLDEDGREIQVNTGKSYIAVVREELENELKLDYAVPAASSEALDS